MAQQNTVVQLAYEENLAFLNKSHGKGRSLFSHKKKEAERKKRTL